MKKKILIIVYILLIITFIYMSIVSILNKIIVYNFKKGKYDDTLAKILTNITFQRSSIANYNYGNILYKKGKYDEAEIEYKKSLDNLHSKKEECQIRINYALDKCKEVNIDEKDVDSIKEGIATYEEAINILTEKNCDKHNEDAKQLKQDIEDEIERLENLMDDSSDKKDSKDEQENQNNEDKEDEIQNIEEQIKNIKEEAINEQKESEELYESYNKEFNFGTKNW